MSLFMLDTNICVDLIRGRAPELVGRLRKYPPDDIAISSISLAELQYGAVKSARPDWHLGLLAEFCAPLAILEFGNQAAEAYGKVRLALERAGTPIGPLDTLIAAHALAENMTVVTNNLREFRRVRGLKVEDFL